ncbi:MAG: tetratricopeptide repeat protein [Betaproteobacteria bacterium]|nr:tetratricopeptide repeat protein [Betaproteobacteria bacterium]
MWLGNIELDELRWDEAIKVFDKLLRIRVDPFSLGNLGVCYWKVGQLAEAEYCLRGAIELKPSFTRAHVSLAYVLHALRQFGAALTQLTIAAKVDPKEHQVPMREGCTLAALGRFDEAQLAFEQARELAGRFSYSRLVAFDRKTFDAITGPEASVSAPQSALQSAARAGDVRDVTLISCNPPYVRKYGFPFIRSFAATNRRDDRLLHLHIYDPDASIIGEVAALLGKCGLERYAVTTETCPFPEQAVQQRKAYYACGRLVHLPYWLDHYRCPILSLDVDFIVERALDGLLDAARKSDVGLNLRDPADSPWLDVIANIIVAQPTPAARHYFAAVKNYALDFLRREPDAWLVDQSALYCVLKMMERFAEPPAVAWIPAERQNCLWHIGHAYDYLLADPRYLKYAGDHTA